ncbi:MAG: AAA-like domain-containing protein [Caldilineaceae bacterium]
MRIFNTSGACIPEEHYTVMRQALVAEGEALVAQGRFFTIFAPRQSGKTTYFQLLFRHLDPAGYTTIRVSFEGMKTLTRSKFYQVLGQRLARGLSEQGITAKFSFADQADFQTSLESSRWPDQKLVLVIDEFEEIAPDVVSELLHIFRDIYQYKQYYAIQALILVGVSTLAELVVSSASPFNIVDQLQIPYFTFAEIEELIQQYVTETGQPFDAQVIKTIYDNARGQPGLVNALCQYLVDVMVPDRSQPVTMDAFYPTLKHFLTERFDKNILNVISKARAKQAFMLKLLFGETPIPFTINDPTIAFLYANGVVDNVDGYVQTLVPLYSKALLTALRPTINGETKEYVSAHETFKDYVSDEGLNMPAILTRYREYVQRRGFHAFDTEHLREGAWHYSLDGFIIFFIQQLGGDTLLEVPSGRGRTDILILYKAHKYIIETKIFLSQTQVEHGKQQLADYCISENIAEGFYVVFTQKHSETDALFFDEMVNGKRILTYLIRTNFEPPSTRPLDTQPDNPATRGKRSE